MPRSRGKDGAKQLWVQRGQLLQRRRNRARRAAGRRFGRAGVGGCRCGVASIGTGFTRDLGHRGHRGWKRRRGASSPPRWRRRKLSQAARARLRLRLPGRRGTAVWSGVGWWSVIEGSKERQKSLQSCQSEGKGLWIDITHRPAPHPTPCTQWRTGVSVPLCKWVMQPMLAEVITVGSNAPKWLSLRSRSCWEG